MDNNDEHHESDEEEDEEEEERDADVLEGGVAEPKGSRSASSADIVRLSSVVKYYFYTRFSQKVY